jgi:tRNA(adenine34) deaminase
MDLTKQVSAFGKIDRRKFLGAAALGGLSTSLALPLAVETPAAAAADTASEPGDERIRKLDHAAHMRRAIAQARNNPRYPFGAVIVRIGDGSVVAEGYNRTSINPTWHGEMDAIDQYAARHPGADWSGLALYTTCEPCAMCQSAVLWAGIAGVIFGPSIPFYAGLAGWAIDIRAEEVIRRTGFRHCMLIGGILEQECNALFVAASKLLPQG